MLGEEYSTITVCGLATAGTPSRGSVPTRVASAAIHSSLSLKLMNPGPLTRGSSLMSATSRWARMPLATSRGASFLPCSLPSFWASGSAALDWKSANDDGRITGSVSA